MKLLFLIDFLGSGGAQRQIVTIIPLLKQKGVEVEVLCYHEDTFFMDILDRNSVKIHWLLIKNPILRMWKIRSFIRQGNYNAVISFLDTPDFLNCISAIGGHTWKVITSERSAKEDAFFSYRGRLMGWFKQYSDIIVCNSNNASRMWLKHYPQYRDKLKVTYNIVTLPLIVSKYMPRKEGKTHIVVAASYQYLKNPINLIKAVNLLDDSQKDKLILDWYGSKKASQSSAQVFNESTKLISQYNLDKVIHLNEAVSNIADRMNEADVVGLFSQFEGLPNAICEAMSLSKPIIMSRVSDWDVLVDENNGVLCEWNNVDSIKKALNTILTISDDQLLAAGESSGKKAKLLFDPETIIKRWEAIIGL